MASWWSVCVVWPLLIFAVAGDTAPCKYEDAVCSCKLGEANQGTCWDKVAGIPGTCKSRPCLKGWTCACAGRTHLCPRVDANVNTPLLPSNIPIPATAPCNTTTMKKVTYPKLKLGMLNLSISEAGVRADKCTQFTWYHNGELRGDWGNEGAVALSGLGDNDTAKAVADRGVHTLLDILPGDLIAFQFTDASYYCYKSLAAIQANDLNITTDMQGVETYYAREFSDHWFRPNYTIDATTLGTTESDTNDLTKFLTPRKSLLTPDLNGNFTAIVPGTDYWQPDDGENADHARGNWYWRIHIPKDLPNPAGGSITF